MIDLPIEITFQVLRHLNDLGVPYMLVGSVASSLQGIARSTIDADVVADLDLQRARALQRRLEADFYVSESAVLEAVNRHSMFNVIHYSSGFKIDIYLLAPGPFETEEFRRRTALDCDGKELWVATPEDLIVSKLNWYRLGNEVSERQWRDLVGLLQLHTRTLDQDYLLHWTAQLGLEGLLARARQAAGA